MISSNYSANSSGSSFYLYSSCTSERRFSIVVFPTVDDLKNSFLFLLDFVAVFTFLCMAVKKSDGGLSTFTKLFLNIMAFYI